MGSGPSVPETDGEEPGRREEDQQHGDQRFGPWRRASAPCPTPAATATARASATCPTPAPAVATARSPATTAAVLRVRHAHYRIGGEHESRRRY